MIDGLVVLIVVVCVVLLWYALEMVVKEVRRG